MIDPSRRGRRALVYYRGGAAGEAVSEDISAGQPAEIPIGCGAVPPGIDDLLFEMQVEEERVVTLPPEKAFGKHDPSWVQSYGRLFLKDGDKLQIGDWITWTKPTTQHRIPGRVTAATRDTVTLDFNHPFAGKDVQYWVKLLAIV
jgi:FKBP-type peptidyl-prolyl cis-trans isomerase 2